MTKFNPGDPVLVRAFVKGNLTDSALPAEVECVILKTEFGNIIIEAEGRLLAAISSPYEQLASVEQRVERFARVMAKADGVDPDQLATPFQPAVYSIGWVIDQTLPAWRLYAKYAQALIDAELAWALERKQRCAYFSST